MEFSNLLLIFTTMSVGLMAGLFFSFTSAVMPGLSQLGDADFIMAMKAINRSIQNPVFFIVFFGALISLPVSTFLKYSAPPTVVFWMLLAATIIYLAGVFGVTAAGNIPLNNALDKFNVVEATKEALQLQRTTFETRWNQLNTIRTICSIASFILIVIAWLSGTQGVVKVID